MTTLLDTNSAEMAAEFVRARKRSGSPTMGMVMTLVVVVPESEALAALEVARMASHEHPARVLGVILGDGRGKAEVNAELGIGDGWSGETALIRLKGEVVRHAESVVLPLLLPDSPVAVWWPVDPPADPAAHPLGRLAQRRVTDSAAATKGRTTALLQQAASYTRGNTDLAWTRLTPWRAVLAAALDQHPMKPQSATVSGERVSPSTDLLVSWLSDRLGVDVERTTSPGPGITEVRFQGADGEIVVARGDGASATLRVPGFPDRPVALARRTLAALMAEELRHLDEDEPYAETARHLLQLAQEATADD